MPKPLLLEKARSTFNLRTQWPVVTVFALLFIGTSWFTTAFPRSILTTPILILAFMLIFMAMSLFTMSVIVFEDRIVRRSLFGVVEVSPAKVDGLHLRSRGLTQGLYLTVKDAGAMTIPIGYLGNGQAVAKAMLEVVQQSNRKASIDPKLIEMAGKRTG